MFKYLVINAATGEPLLDEAGEMIGSDSMEEAINLAQCLCTVELPHLGVVERCEE